MLAVTNAAMLFWAVSAHVQKRPLPPAYFRGYALSHLLAALLVIMGLTFLGRGMVAPSMHIFYGLVATAGTVAQLVLRPKTAVGQRYRGKPLAHAILALAVLLAALRAILVALP